MDHSYSYSFDAENQVFRIAPCFSIIPIIRTNQNDGSIIKADAIHHLFEHTPQIVFEVTEKCNFDCAYCGYGENYKQPQLRPLHSNRFMKWETAKAVLDYYLDVWRRHDCATMIRIGFYGGEPLLNYSLIKQIVNYLKDNKPYHISFGWFITTNGSLLKKYSSFLIENDFSIAVSIDGDAVANSLRIRHNGEPTYSVVMDNIDYLYHNYSDFFRKSISFQSVITNKVNTIDVLDYLWEKYHVLTKVIELSRNHLCPHNSILGLYNCIKDDLESSYISNKERFDKMGLNPPLTKGIIDCIKTLTSYYHLSYDDFFKKQEGDDFLTFYSGTCHPFQTRVFISTPGLIFPCEKVDFETPLGYIDSNNTIVIDFESIAKYYNTLYTCLKKFCPSCIHQFNCQHCFVQDGYFHDGEARCSDYKALNQKNLLELINFVRDHSDLLPLVQRII